MKLGVNSVLFKPFSIMEAMQAIKRAGFDGVELSAKKFSGVTDILWEDYILPSDFSLSLDHFSVTGGNFRMMVINEGEIIADIQPGDHVDILIEDITGYTTVRIAGESAAFSIAMTELQYDLFQHE